MVLLPNLAVRDVEDMSLIEIEKRIEFVGKLKREKRKVEMKDMFSMLHFTIKSGTAQFSKKGEAVRANKSFYKTLDKCLDIKTENIIDDIDDVKEFMEALNGKK